MILALDPGPVQTAWVLFDGEQVVQCGIGTNVEMYAWWPSFPIPVKLVIEDVQHYGTGMPAGKDVFETCVWIGRFMEAWYSNGGGTVTRISRPRIKSLLCGSARAKDANVRQALIDRVGPKGTKRNPGPTYGCKSHIWSALAAAVAYTIEQEIPAT